MSAEVHATNALTEKLFSVLADTAMEEAKQLSKIQALLAANADKIDIDAKTEGGWTALQLAAHLDKPEVAKALIAAGADVNAGAPDGFTPLHLAAKAGSAEMTRLLVNSGANVNAFLSSNQVRGEKYTPIDVAMANGSHRRGLEGKQPFCQVIKILSEAGALADPKKVKMWLDKLPTPLSPINRARWASPSRETVQYAFHTGKMDHADRAETTRSRPAGRHRHE